MSKAQRRNKYNKSKKDKEKYWKYDDSRQPHDDSTGQEKIRHTSTSLPQKWNKKYLDDYCLKLVICLQDEIDVQLNDIMDILNHGQKVRRGIRKSDIKDWSWNPKTGKVTVEFACAEKVELILEDAKTTTDRNILLRSGRTIEAFLNEYFPSPLLDEMAYLGRLLKRAGKVSAIRYQDGNIKIKLKRNNMWVQVNQITDFYQLFPSFEFSEINKGNNAKESDFIEFEEEEWDRPDHIRLEIVGIQDGVMQVEELKGEVFLLINHTIQERLTWEEIVSCSRRRSNGPILVEFTSSEVGDKVFQNRALFSHISNHNDDGNDGGVARRIFIDEHLSALVRKLSYHARELKKQNMIKQFSTEKKRIRIKIHSEDSWLFISRMEDFTKYFPRYEFDR